MLNGKYKCLFWEGNAFKSGKVYEFVDGHAIMESGVRTLCPLSEKESIFFKFEKIDLPQPHKSLLKSGDKVVYRDGNERFVLVETMSLYKKEGWFACFLCDFTNDLLWNGTYNYNDILEIWRGDELIAKRIEKSEKEIEIERIENEMRKLADDLRKVKGE